MHRGSSGAVFIPLSTISFSRVTSFSFLFLVLLSGWWGEGFFFLLLFGIRLIYFLFTQYPFLLFS